MPYRVAHKEKCDINLSQDVMLNKSRQETQHKPKMKANISRAN